MECTRYIKDRDIDDERSKQTQYALHSQDRQVGVQDTTPIMYLVHPNFALCTP